MFSRMNIDVNYGIFLLVLEKLPLLQDVVIAIS